MLAANQENAGGLPPGINALKRELSELEADCERRRSDLLKSIEILEKAANNSLPLTKPENTAVYRYLTMAGAVAFYLDTHGGKAKLTDMANDLEALGVVLSSSPTRGGDHNLKILFSQGKYKKQFSYNPKTDVVTLKLSRD